MPTAVRSHAKINMGLYLGAPRADGFHSLVTAYQTLEIHDIVTVTATRSAQTTLRLSSNDASVPTDERNTAWRMISLALEEMGTGAAVVVHIEKRLPVQGGLGAGSGNAVAALVGLVKEIRDQRSEIRTSSAPGPDVFSELGGKGWAGRWMEIAAKVGSDVPLFLVGGTVLGQDRGQEVSPLPDHEPTWCVVVVPEVGVSTPQAFRDWDALCAAEGLTPEASADRLKEPRLCQRLSGSDSRGWPWSRLLRCLLRGRRPGRTARGNTKVWACPHRDHELDRERLRTRCLSPASLPC